MGIFKRSSSSSTSGAENAGGTDWDAKAEKSGKGGSYTVFGKGSGWGKPETSGGSGGSLSDEQSGADGSIQ